MVDGDFELVENTSDNILAFWRKLEDENWLVVANLSGEDQNLNLDIPFKEVLISNYLNFPLTKVGLYLENSIV